MKRIYFENFSDFPLGEYPYDKECSAIGEYHYVKEEGYYGNWYDPITNHQFRSLGGNWMVTYNGKYCMEQNRGQQSKGHFLSVTPCLILKKPDMTNYQYSVFLNIYDFKNLSGVTFHYVHSKKHLAFVFENGFIKAYYRNQEDVIVLSLKEYIMEERQYKITVISNNGRFDILVDDKHELSFVFDEIEKGKVGLLSVAPCAYSDVEVCMEEKDSKKYFDGIKADEEKLEQKRKKYAPLELVKKLDLKNFGTGRQIRIGHLNEKEYFIVFIQHQKRLYRDAFAHISCITAMDFNGNVLWQKGMPNNKFESTVISCDLPIQIFDIDNDGIDEVIYAQNFEVVIINALTGEEKKRMKTPLMDEEYPYNRLNVDAIRGADFRGNGYMGDFIIKDRYKNVWAYDNNFNQLWHYNHKNTGHFPYIHDFNNDGHDEMYVGYDMVSSQGEILWSLPINSDHTDEIIYASLSGEEKRLYLASGNEGFNVVSLDGKIIQSHKVGHAQRISLGHFQKDNPDMQICVTSFWGANGIIYLFDKDGKRLVEKEKSGNGYVITPIAYDGVEELILLNGSSTDGGLADGKLDVVVCFPDDGHPTLCAEAFDLDNDGVDEILLWDQKSLWIYKSSVIKEKAKYEKYPLSSFSNYRGEFSIKKIFKK